MEGTSQARFHLLSNLYVLERDEFFCSPHQMVFSLKVRFEGICMLRITSKRLLFICFFIFQDLLRWIKEGGSVVEKGAVWGWLTHNTFLHTSSPNENSFYLIQMKDSEEQVTCSTLLFIIHNIYACSVIA